MDKNEPKKPTIFKKKSITVNLYPGHYEICSCGLSETQPYCDGAHKGTEFKPKLLEPSPVMESGRVKTEGETRPRRDFCIVHQYDRVPAWRHLIQMKYSS